MRKLLSAILAFLLLLNILGHYGLLLGWQFKSDLTVNKKLDSGDYDQSKTVTIMIPLTVPYASDSRGFERVSGKFEHKGEFYRLIKQRLYRDTLQVVCLKDAELKEIHHALTNYVESFTDSPVDTQSSNTKSTLSFIKDYVASSIGIRSLNAGWAETISYAHAKVLYISSFRPSIHQPPQV